MRQTRRERRWPHLPRQVLLLASGLAVFLVGFTALGLSHSMSRSAPQGTEPPSQMISVAPPGVLSPDAVSQEVALLYQTAHTHEEVFMAVPCFCGCQEMLDHGSLHECFIRADGQWEAHGAGCGVCLGEARQIRDLLAAGVTDLEEIRQAVVAEWGDPYLHG